MIIDSHHHLWKYNRQDYSWMDDGMEVLRKDHLPGLLIETLSHIPVAGTVVVQARQSLEESRWLLNLAGESNIIKGVVGWVDLCSDKVEEELGELSINPLFKGVRHVLQNEKDDTFMLRHDFLKGIGRLKAHNLCYDLLIYPRHLKHAAKLVSMFPDQKFVIDHMAKPDIRGGIVEPWLKEMRILAGFPNVWVKVSGMVTEAHHISWKYSDFIPFLDGITEAFGFNRLMYGSDWPVCTLAASYSEVFDVVKTYYSTFPEEDQARFFSGNCMDFYNLIR